MTGTVSPADLRREFERAQEQKERVTQPTSESSTTATTASTTSSSTLNPSDFHRTDDRVDMDEEHSPLPEFPSATNKRQSSFTLGEASRRFEGDDRLRTQAATAFMQTVRQHTPEGSSSTSTPTSNSTSAQQ